MEQTIPTTGYESSVTDHRSLGGTIVFVALLATVLLAAAHPGLAAAAVLGALGAHIAGTVGAKRRARSRRYGG